MDMQLSVEKLKQQRDSRAWTQGHLAEVSGISLRTIQRIEKSGVSSQESAQAICAAYEITVDHLLDKMVEEESKQPEKIKKYQRKYLIPAIITLGMAISFKFNSNQITWLWESEPGLGIAFGAVSIVLWVILLYQSNESKSL